MTTLTSRRLRLRPFKREDINELFEIIQDDKIKKFLPGIHTESKELLAENLEIYVHANFRDDIYFAITDIDTNRLIGGIVLVRTLKNNMEISYFISKERREKGLMFEALQTFLKWYRLSKFKNTIVFSVSKSNDSSLFLCAKMNELRIPILNIAEDIDTVYYIIRPWCLT